MKTNIETKILVDGEFYEKFRDGCNVDTSDNRDLILYSLFCSVVFGGLSLREACVCGDNIRNEQHAYSFLDSVEMLMNTLEEKHKYLFRIPDDALAEIFLQFKQFAFCEENLNFLAEKLIKNTSTKS